MSPAQTSARSAVALVLALSLGSFFVMGCRKRTAPPAPGNGKAQAAYSCPASDAIARSLQSQGRTLHVGCHAYAMGHFWLAAAFGHGDAPAAPKLELVSGGAGDLMVFDVPLGAAASQALEQLVRGNDRIEVSVRPGQGEGNLLRLGVLGRKRLPGGDDQVEEIVALLQLVAHAPPHLLWVGPGDKTVVADGCVLERRVAFQMLFGRVDLVSSESGRRAASAAGKAPGTTCAGGPGMQEGLPSRGTALPPGRRVPFTGTSG